MSQHPYVGLPKAALDTPALLVDLEILDRNIAYIASACRAGGKAWRPHTKGFTVPQIAHKALDAGAIGVTCATIGGAETMVAAGITDIMIANQLVGSKLARLAKLCRVAKLSVAVDDPAHVQALDAAAASADVRIGVLIEVDIGIHRAGVRAGPAVAQLARQISSSTHLRFMGLMGWEGHTCPIQPIESKEAAITEAIQLLNASAQACRDAGLTVEIISCGGTGTFPITVRQPGVTEIQAGGGVLCDVRYRTKYGVELEPALTMLTTVTSRPNQRRIICDGGKKSMSDHPVLPKPLGLDEVERVVLSAEHITVELGGSQVLPHIGDRLEFEASYVDLTVLLHDALIATRRGVVEDVWPVRQCAIVAETARRPEGSIIRLASTTA